MTFNFLTDLQTCFDLVRDTVNVSLIYYSHIPVAVISLVLGVAIFVKSKNLMSKIFLALTATFSLWSVFSLITWTSYNSISYMFFWSFFGILIALISILCLYFTFVFINNRDVHLLTKIIWLILLLPILVISPTKYNLPTFDGVWCIPTENSYFNYYYYFFGVAAFIGVLIIFIKKYRSSVLDKKNILFVIGMECFLFMFLSTDFLASYLVDNGYITNYDIAPYGLFGMVIFIAFLSYIIVKFKSFNVKMFGAQALIFALIALIGSEFFFITTNTNRILTAITLVITGFIGINLMRSVKKEITQREKIEDLATKLEKSNAGLEKANSRLADANDKLKELDQLKSEFVSLATHQIRAPLSAIKGYLSEVFEGDFGPINKELEKPLQIVFQSTENLVHIVGDFLNISRIEQGKMKYELAPLDMKNLVEETIKELKPNLDRAGLELKTEIPEGHHEVYADAGKVKQVIGNLIDNSMKYTPKGSIKVSLSTNEKTQKVLFAISDTGIGIAPEVMPKLFQKFSRAKNANEVNIIGTGLGLYVAKLMIEGQSGRIWAESPGAGKGSTFYVELPVAHVS